MADIVYVIILTNNEDNSSNVNAVFYDSKDAKDYVKSKKRKLAGTSFSLAINECGVMTDDNMQEL